MCSRTTKDNNGKNSTRVGKPIDLHYTCIDIGIALFDRQ